MRQKVPLSSGKKGGGLKSSIENPARQRGGSPFGEEEKKIKEAKKTRIFRYLEGGKKELREKLLGCLRKRVHVPFI